MPFSLSVRRVALLVLSTLLFCASCKGGSKYVIPADSVQLAGCPIPGVSLPPGTVVEADPSSSHWGVHAQIGSDWDGLLRHLDAVMKLQGYRRAAKLPGASKPDAKSARYEKAGSLQFLIVVLKPAKPGFNCIITVAGI